MKPSLWVRGFTLLEVLVTLAIFTLLFAVLMSGWYQVMLAQTRLADAARLVQQQQLVLALRQFISELLSPRAGRGTEFVGTRKGLVGETSASLAPGLGDAPVPTSLQVEGETPNLAIRVTHSGQGSVRLPWLIVAAEFRFLDSAGRTHSDWPPQPTTTSAQIGQAPGLPALIQLTLQLPGQTRATTLLFAPRPSAWQPPEPVSPFDIKVD